MNKMQLHTTIQLQFTQYNYQFIQLWTTLCSIVVFSLRGGIVIEHEVSSADQISFCSIIFQIVQEITKLSKIRLILNTKIIPSTSFNIQYRLLLR